MGLPEPTPHYPDPVNITEERAVRRFHQMRRLESQLTKVDKRIADVKLTLSTLRDEREGYVVAILAAARDEGTLPLFDLDEE